MSLHVTKKLHPADSGAEVREQPLNNLLASIPGQGLHETEPKVRKSPQFAGIYLIRLIFLVVLLVGGCPNKVFFVSFDSIHIQSLLKAF